MEGHENLVTEVTENVDTTTTEEIVGEVVETPKTYTQEEVDSIVGERLARERAKNTRNEARIRKDYERKYGQLESVLKAGTGKESIEEMTTTFADFYKSKGIEIPAEPTYSAKDIEVLARAEAKDIINGGLEDVVEEVDRLAGIGAANMNARERALFKELAEYRQNAEKGLELSKLGVSEDVYTSAEFKEFAGQFNPSTPITKIYEIYNKMQPKKEIRTMGSMITNTPAETGVKDFYTRDEALKFTKKDFDSNPELFKAVERSMTKW